jgi:hypothetical protein
MIAGSRTEAQIEAAALAEAAQRSDRPMVLAMKEIEMWARQQIQGKMYDSPYDLRKVMKECGMQPSKSRIFVQNRLQYVIANTAAMQKLKGALDGSQMDMVKTMVVKPSEILEGSM